MFIDSEINTVGNQGKCRVIIPNHPFQIYGPEKMQLTLLSFEMKRNWYNINQSNNTFYLYSASSDAYYEVRVRPGLYKKFDVESTSGGKGLGEALKDALDVTCDDIATIQSNSCVCHEVIYDENSRFFKFDLRGAGLSTDMQVVFFHCKSGTVPANVSDSGFYNDSYEIFGGVPTRDVNNLKNGFNKDLASTSASTIFESFLPVSLNSLEAIYLRSNLQTSNFMTNGFSKDSPDRNTMTETNIFARIALNRSCFDDIFSFVQFEDSNNLFQMHLHQKSLDSITLEVTDDKGRLLSEVYREQADLGLMNFKCTIKWDVLTPIRNDEKPVLPDRK